MACIPCCDAIWSKPPCACCDCTKDWSLTGNEPAAAGNAGETSMTSNIARRALLTRATIAAAGLALPAIWRSGRAFAQGAVTLKLGHPDTPLHPTQAVATKFSELVAAKTGGAVRIQVFSGGQLGNQVNIVSGIQTGLVDMAFHTTPSLQWFFPPTHA